MPHDETGGLGGRPSPSACNEESYGRNDDNPHGQPRRTGVRQRSAQPVTSIPGQLNRLTPRTQIK